jgi:hypothetical protein
MIVTAHHGARRDMIPQPYDSISKNYFNKFGLCPGNVQYSTGLCLTRLLLNIFIVEFSMWKGGGAELAKAVLHQVYIYCSTDEINDEGVLFRPIASAIIRL